MPDKITYTKLLYVQCITTCIDKSVLQQMSLIQQWHRKIFCSRGADAAGEARLQL